MAGKDSTKRLAPKQLRFVQEYLLDLNATQAAIRAGYSAKTAKAIGSRLLTNVDVEQAIAAAKSRRVERSEVTADRVIAELAVVAFSDLGDVVKVLEDGSVQVLPLDQLRPEVRRALSEISQTTSERYDPQSKSTLEKVRLGVKLHSKVKALELLMNHFGLNAPQKVDVTGTLQVATAKATLGAKLDELSKRVALPAEPGGEAGSEPGATS
jgi:phage terminase small subunit